MTPDTNPTAPAPAAPVITPDRWAAFHALVRDTRNLQRLYRKTMDPMLRREAAAVEEQLDTEVGYLAADLAAAAEEGGVS